MVININAGFDVEEYKKKIDKLKKCYPKSSRIMDNHYFYIPIKENDT